MKYLIIFIITQVIITEVILYYHIFQIRNKNVNFLYNIYLLLQPIFSQLVPVGTKCGCIEVPVERKCGCFDFPILPKQELITPMKNIGFGNQRQNLLPRNNMLGNQYANMMPLNRELNLFDNIPFNNMYMPSKMVTTRSLSLLKTPVPMQYNRLPNYIDDYRRNENVMNLKSQLAQLAGLAMTSANLLSSLPSFSNNIITKNALNSLPMQDLGLGNLGYKPISYQNNIVPRLF